MGRPDARPQAELVVGDGCGYMSHTRSNYYDTPPIVISINEGMVTLDTGETLPSSHLYYLPTPRVIDERRKILDEYRFDCKERDVPYDPYSCPLATESTWKRREYIRAVQSGERCTGRDRGSSKGD